MTLCFWLHNPPDFINDLGIKWWKHDEITNYAKHEDLNNISLKNVSGWVIKDMDGNYDFLLLKDDCPIYANTSYEAIGAHIDMLKLLEHFKEKEENE